MVDTGDLKSPGFGRAGSSPAAGTTRAETGALAEYEALRLGLRAGHPPRSLPAALRFLPDGAAQDPAEAHRTLIGQCFPAAPLRDYLAQELRQVIDSAMAAPENRGRVLAWGGAYVAEAALVAHGRCPEAGFLEVFLAYADHVVATRDSDLGLVDTAHGRVMPAWSSRRLDPDRNTTMITHFARIVAPLLRALRLQREDPAHAIGPDREARFLQVFREGFAAFEEDYRPVPGTGCHWYLRPVLREWEPLNHMMIVAGAALDAWALTGDAALRARVEAIFDVLELSSTRHRDGSVSWPYRPRFAAPTARDRVRAGVHGLSGRLSSVIAALRGRAPRPRRSANIRPSEPIWKASMSLPVLAAAVDLGLHEQSRYVDPVADTFMRSIATPAGLLTDMHPRGSARFDPLRMPPGLLSQTGFVAGWFSLARLRPDLGDHLTRFVADHPELFADGWLGAPLTARGYAANLTC